MYFHATTMFILNIVLETFATNIGMTWLSVKNNGSLALPNGIHSHPIAASVPTSDFVGASVRRTVLCVHRTGQPD